MDDDSSRNGKIASAGSILAGVVAAAGWYTFAGTLLTAPQVATWNASDASNKPLAPDGVKNGAYWAPGILQSFALVGLNIVNWEAVTDDGGLAGDGPPIAARAFVTFMFIVAFGALGGAIWIMAQDLSNAAVWGGAGIACLIQNLLILAASIIFRASRRSGDHAV